MKKLYSILTGLILTGSCLSAQQRDPVSLKVLEEQQRVEVYISGALFTTYRYEGELEKPVLFPVLAPGGIEVTRGFPLEPRAGERIDHPHHVGLWFNYGDVNGFDFWNNSRAIPAERKGGYGRITHDRILKAGSGDRTGVLEVSMDWMAPDDDRAERLLREQTTYLFQGRGDIRMIDRITRLTAIADTVVFTDNKEGMLAIRVARAFELPSDDPVVLSNASGQPGGEPVVDHAGVTGWYLNSEGDQGPSAWGKNARWVRLSGTRDGQRCSLVLMDHPGNINYPACWHARGYGLFSVNNLGREVYNRKLERFRLLLKQGESITFRHRFVVTAGDLEAAQIEALFREFTTE